MNTSTALHGLLYGTVFAVGTKKCKNLCYRMKLKRKYNESPYVRGKRCTECEMYLEVPKNVFYCFCCGSGLRTGPRRKK